MAFISILVRARNDEVLIKRTLEGIFSQKTDHPFEVVVCDDASTDRTKEVASKFPVRFFTRPEGPYKPGKTLNALVRDAKGDLLVFNNSDSVPLDEHWLERLVAPLLAEPDKPKFAFANQMPRQDATALVRKDSERAFGDGKIHATWRFFFSLASSATWKRLLMEEPFDEKIQFSEDVDWTWRNSRRPVNPVEVVYCPDSHVEHSHNYTMKELVKRFKGEGVADRVIYGDRPAFLRELAGAAMETLRDWVYLTKQPGGWREIPEAPVRRVIQRLSHWAGIRQACKEEGK